MICRITKAGVVKESWASGKCICKKIFQGFWKIYLVLHWKLTVHRHPAAKQRGGAARGRVRFEVRLFSVKVWQDSQSTHVHPEAHRSPVCRLSFLYN